MGWEKMKIEKIQLEEEILEKEEAMAGMGYAFKTFKEYHL
jgi:hypothetical protein